MNSKQINVTVKRSGRKTVGIQVQRDGSVVVRAPYRIPEKEIYRILEEKREWIMRHRQEILRRTADAEPLTAEEIRELADRAARVIPERAAYYARMMGVTYGRITIRKQKTRWGSCSAAGNLNFNCLLMLTPPEVTDSVVVHELAHRKEMNHSAAFYREVRRVFPDYDKWNQWLKENGPAIMARG